jgi:hypothetical protein
MRITVIAELVAPAFFTADQGTPCAESGAASSGLARSSPEIPKLLATHGRRAIDDV